MIHIINMTSLPMAGQMFFKAIEALNNGHREIGMQTLDALRVCAFPQVAARAEDARRRFSQPQGEVR